MAQEFATVDVVRLEVETAPEGLVNLVGNPNGELGGWGWITPVPNTRMRTGNAPVSFSFLAYESSVAQASHFTTEPAVVSAGDYVAGFFAMPFVTSGCTIRARLEFLDAAGAVMSSGPQTGYFEAVGEYTVPAIEVPAGAERVWLRCDLYDGATTSPPAMATVVYLRQVTVAAAATSGGLGEVRKNLAPNPSFEVDAYGWVGVGAAEVSRVTSPAGSSGSACLQVEATAPGDVGAEFGAQPWPDRLIPITPGEYRVSLYVRSAAVTRQAFLRMSWHDSTGVQVGATTSTDAATLVGSWSRLSTPALTPPAPATHVRVAVVFRSTAEGEIHYADALLVERTGELGGYFDGDSASSPEKTYDWLTFPPVERVRTNLVPNPSFEVNTTGWATDNATLARVTSPAGLFGNACARIAPYAAPAGIKLRHISGGQGYIPITGQKVYTYSVYVRSSTTSRPAHLTIAWWANVGSMESRGVVSSSPVLTTPGQWTRMSLVAVAPTGATHAELFAQVNGVTNDEYQYFDALLFEETNRLLPYFDGSTGAASDEHTVISDRAWSGTAHNSTSSQTETTTLPYSTENATTLGYIPPVEYLNVLPESHQIRVSREGLNVGELGATILSRTLNPAQSTLIRPGRRARLSTLVGNQWETILSGKLLEADVTYELKDPTVPDEKRARIEVTIVDPTQTLANATRPEGVATIDELPFVLEGAGVPWNVNGSGNQVPVAAVTTYNENAHAVDQVALTRDTAIGYAWMSRVGVINAWDRDLIPSGSPVLLDEDDYSDLDLSFSTKDCINEVAITVQALGADGSTEETVYGPFMDAASISEWGRYRKEFTVTGLNSAQVEDLATQILAANATPRIRVNSITLPLTTTTRREARALLDLYTETQVVLTAEGIDDVLRVTGIEHTIDTDRWFLKLTFSDEGGVASPTVQPPVQAGARPDVGVIELFAGPLSQLPATKIVCDGTSYPISAYPHLFNVIGHTFGGSGAFFNVPNLVERFPIGAGVKALGTTGGSPTKTLSAGNIPSHRHGISVDYTQDVPTNGNAIRVLRVGGAGAGGSGGTSGTGLTNYYGNNDAFDIMPPWAAIYYVIRAA